MSGTSLRSTTTAPSCPLGLENTKSVRNAVPLNVAVGDPWLSVPSTGAPRPGMTTPPPPGVGVGVLPGGRLESPPDGGAPDPGASGGGWAPPLSFGPIVGMPADASASLTPASRLASGDATASEAALWIDGLGRNSQKMIGGTRRP